MGFGRATSARPSFAAIFAPAPDRRGFRPPSTTSLVDPVQSMDDVHVTHFAALLRTLSKEQERQIIIAVTIDNSLSISNSS
jgi:hypothetical protein